MDIVFNRCCGETPMALYVENERKVYLQCPVCGRKSDTIPVRNWTHASKMADEKAAAECAKRWNEHEGKRSSK
jgi:hypothetical protein